MKIAMVGLGRMGMNMARRLLQSGHQVIGYNKSAPKIDQLASEGAIAAYTLEEVVAKFDGDGPKIIWLMLPAGEVTESHIAQFSKLLAPGDILIEGGNSHYKDDLRRTKELEPTGIEYVDGGISGGIWGLKTGYASMIGGKKSVFDHIEPIIKDLAPENGYLYCGETGAGHYVKMIHNGIEYALMESYGEGFDILKASPYGKDLNLESVARMWQNGSVIRSWLLDLLGDVFAASPNLKDVKGYVPDSGEARWTAQEAIDLGVAADLITTSLFKRFNSRQEDVFANKVNAALRNAFGGHLLAKEGADLRGSDAGAGRVSHAKQDQTYDINQK